MTEYNKVNVARNQTGVTLRINIKMFDGESSTKSLPHNLLLTRQRTKFRIHLTTIWQLI